MKKKTLTCLLLALSSGAFVVGGIAANCSSSPMSVSAQGGFGTDVVEITDGDTFAETINNATDGLFVKVMNDISFEDKIVVPENCFVTVEMNGHTVSYTSNSSDNLGVELTSTIMFQNGTWSGTLDTDNWASGTIILNGFKQVLPEGEEDLTSGGTDCNPKGLIFLGNTNMWIVNNSSVHRISTENGYINPGAETLNPWGPHHTNPEESEIELSLKQPYNFANPAPAMVGSGTTWEIKATLQEDFERAQTGGDVYKNVILLKDATLAADATFAAADKSFDLAGHSLSLGEFGLHVTNDSGLNSIRNGSIDGDIDLSIGSGEVELASLETPGIIANSAHALTVDGGHYSSITTDSGMVCLKEGYFSGTYTGVNFEMSGGYYVNQPDASQITLGSESGSCSIVEKGITYNYAIVDTQPNKDNDYTAALNDTVPGASFQWYKRAVSRVLVDDNYYNYLEVGTAVSPGDFTTAYFSYEEIYALALSMDVNILSAGDVMTFKCDSEIENYYDGMGQLTHVGGSEYSYTLNDYYGYLYFAIKSEAEVSVYDMRISVVSDVIIEGETNARLGDIALDNTEYFCKTYKNGNLIKTSARIVPNAVAFTCDTEGVGGDNPATLYQLEGRSISLPANPYTKACYTFDGWYDGSAKIEGSTYIVGASNVELTAKLIIGDHTYSDEWTYNATHHWHAATCSHTEEKSSYAEHDWDSGVIVVEPTEESKGSKKYTCTICGATKTTEVAKLTHEKGEHHPAASATCLTDGHIEYWDCKNCDKQLDADGNVLDSIVVPATGHAYSSEWSSNATHHWHAATCGHDEKSEYSTHTWDEGVITTEPTEEAVGVKTFTCTVCNGTKNEEVAKLTHEKGDHHDAVAATCTTDGSVEYWDCKHCGNKLDADGNVLGSVIVPATGHAYSSEWSSDETHHWHAATCGHDEKSEYSTHAWDEGVIITDPTEETTGVKRYTCTVCGKTKTEDVAKLTHEKGEHHDAVAATCTTDGSVEYWDCKHCGNKLDADGNVLGSVIVPATGHNVTKIEAKDPQVGEAGHKAYYECSECHEYFEDENCTIVITHLASWLNEGGNGYVAPIKPQETNALAWLWISLSILLLLVVFYALGYFFLYRQGRLDDKAIKIIYKWLPRGDKNREKSN